MGVKSIFIGLSAIFCLSFLLMRGHLKFDESFKDLGNIKQGDINTYTFNFTNTGDSKVKISSVVAISPSLYVQPISDSIIPPDGTGQILIDFDTNKHAIGEFAFGISVNSNADNREVKLKIFGVLE